MAGHDRKKQERRANVGRRLLVGMGAGAGVFFAAAAMATGSTVTAGPAHADFDALIDPIIQPILTSLTDSIGAFDPAAALDLTSWSDSFLASLNSIDLALPSVAEPAAAVAAAAEPAASTGGTIPLTVLEGTEPAVNASIAGGSSVPLLVDTGSGGLVIPYTDLGSNFFTQLEALYSLGSPANIGISGYSGGVEYLYATYNSVPVDYAGGFDTNGPVDVELFSWPTSLSSPLSFQTFLADNHVSGILGIGDNTAGPTASPFASDGGVTVNIPGDQLIVGSDAPITGTTLSGAPIVDVFESVNGGTTPLEVTDNIDSGGVFGTIPSGLASSVPSGTVITVENAAHQVLYTYTTVGDFNVGTGTGVSDAPSIVSGSSIDSGVLPFLNHEIYLDYTDHTMTIGPATT
jgi:hypothetical protein